jgi:phosphate butyryltransferase
MSKGGGLAVDNLKQIEKLIEGRQTNANIAVVAAHDKDVLSSVKEVYEKGYAEPILIGDREGILRIADEINMDISHVTIIKEMEDAQSARIAVDLINNGEANILMKGYLQTAELLRITLDKEKGLRTGNLMSHVSVFETENYHKLLFLTDAGINIAPDLRQKVEIIKNAVSVANKLGIVKPKVAALSALEFVNPDMQSSVDAALLSKMAQRGQIRGCVVDGPLALDNAIDINAALHKHIESEVAGDADILLVPDIESGNILYKGLVYLNKAKTCSILMGAKVPIVTTSRADDSITKYYSILLAIAYLLNNL